MKRKIFQILLIASIAIVVGIAIWAYAAKLLAVLGNSQAVTTLLRNSGPWCWFILIILLILQAFLAFIPGQGLTC